MAIKAKELVLLVPAVFLALSLDRTAPDRFKPVRTLVNGMDQAAPMLPAVNEGRGGLPGEPLSLIFIGSVRDVRDALTAAGWTEVPTSLRGALAAGLRPMGDERLLGRRQTMNWAAAARPFAGSRRFRLWLTGIADRNGREVWWGSASGDPDMDRARGDVLKTLAGSPLVQTAALLRLPQIPLSGVDDRGRAYRTDGRAAVIALRRPGPPSKSGR